MAAHTRDTQASCQDLVGESRNYYLGSLRDSRDQTACARRSRATTGAWWLYVYCLCGNVCKQPKIKEVLCDPPVVLVLYAEGTHGSSETCYNKLIKVVISYV